MAHAIRIYGFEETATCALETCTSCFAAPRHLREDSKRAKGSREEVQPGSDKTYARNCFLDVINTPNVL